MHILSFLFDFWFIPPQILDWVTLNFQLWLLKKGISGWRGITSSIYLNWNLSVIYCRFEIKLFSVKAECGWLLYRKNHFSVTSGLADMPSLNFQLLISLLLYIGLSQMALRSYRIPCDIEGHIDLLQGKPIFFLYRLTCRFITPSILERLKCNYQLL